MKPLSKALLPTVRLSPSLISRGSSATPALSSAFCTRPGLASVSQVQATHSRSFIGTNHKPSTLARTPSSALASAPTPASFSTTTHCWHPMETTKSPPSNQAQDQGRDQEMDRDHQINSILSFWFDSPDAIAHWFRPPEGFDDLVRSSFGDLVVAARNHELDNWLSRPRGALALVLLLDQFPRNIYRGTPDAHASDAQALEVAVRSVALEYDQAIIEDDTSTPPPPPPPPPQGAMADNASSGQAQAAETNTTSSRGGGDNDNNNTGSPKPPTFLHSTFFYLPLMHDERLVSQIACVALYESLAARCPPDQKSVKDFIARCITHAKGHRDLILKFGRFPSRNRVLRRPNTPEEESFLKENPDGFLPGTY